jgi:PAS domain S-box-containing protein
MGPIGSHSRREAELEAENAHLRRLLREAGIEAGRLFARPAQGDSPPPGPIPNGESQDSAVRRETLQPRLDRASHSSPAAEARLGSSQENGVEMQRLNSALRESDERYQLALQTAGVVGTWDWDIVEDRLYADARFASLYGVDPVRAGTGAPLDAFVRGIHPEDRDMVDRDIRDAVETGCEFAREYRLRQNDGSIRWVFARGRCFYEDGRPVRFPGIAVDITQRKHAEERQRASEQLLRDIADNLPVLIGYVDKDQRYRFNNKRYAEWFGRTPSELNGLSLRDAIGSDLYENLRPKIEAALAGQRVSFEWASPLGSEGPRFLQSDYIPRRTTDGRLDGFYVLVTDFSERKRTEMALARSEERLRIAQQAGHVGTFEWHLATGEVHVSDELCRLWGFDPRRSVRVGVFLEHVHPDDATRLASVTDKPLEEAVVYVEYRIIRADTAEVRWLARRGEVQYDADGKPERVVGALYDITERKQAEEQQRLLMQELAHRVKNTLAMVQAIATQTMRNAGSLDEARDAFGARLLALAHTHDVLMQGSWATASIRAVVLGATTPHDDGRPGRFRIEGPDLNLGPKTALSLALTLHELGTNAAKYGALSSVGGHVEITWRVEDGDGGARWHFRWQEKDGPSVSPPTRRGFGSRLIERGLAGGLGGQVELSYPPTGVVLTIDASLAEVQEAATA